MPDLQLILVVDDNAVVLRATARILRQAGYEVALATNGEEALARIRTLRPALVLMEFMLPDIAGSEVLRQMRAEPEMTGVHIVLLSSHRISAEHQASGLESGADGYIAQPMAATELLARVRLHLRQRELTEQLRASEARFRNLLQHVPTVAIQGYALDGTVQYWNEASERFYGYTRDEAIGRNLLDLIIPPEIRTEVTSALEGVAAETHAIPNGELDLLRKDGSRITVFSSHAVVRREGHAPELFCFDIDLSERKRAEERIAEQAALLDAASDAIIVKDLAGGILFWNRSAEHIFGWGAGEAIGQDMRALLSVDSAAYGEAMRGLLARNHWRGELNKRTQDGRELTMDVRWTLVRDAAGEPRSILAISTDITERKKFESQFMRAQRMESIGTLAGGIAHDLNNILAPILMSVGLLQREVTSEGGREMLETLRSSSQRGADLVRQVLSFARGIEGQRLLVNPAHLGREIQKIIRETFPKNITFKFQPAPELWTVSGDPTQLHQVFINLCVNARDAMPSGGTLSITMKNVVIDEVYARMNPDARPCAHVLITIADTGTGIPANIRERIFEPFFTTKEIGKGTGLGLSTSLAIVRSHGGFITLSTEAGKGTQFKVYLPASTAAEETGPPAAEVAAPARGHDELILVVDDEEGIRSIAKRTLERFGYRVLLAANGAQAVALYAAQRDAIAVVLTDMAMPVMDGPATIVALKAMNPRIKIIGSSGHASQGGVAKAVGAGVKHFIPKPYTAEKMLSVLAQILQEPV